MKRLAKVWKDDKLELVEHKELGSEYEVVWQLEPGELVLTAQEVTALAHELLNHYVSYSHELARETVKKICYTASMTESTIRQQQVNLDETSFNK